MFKLQDMRNQKHLGWMVKIFFAVVIVSFVFFYGWNNAAKEREAQAREFAKLRSGSISPVDRWQYITNEVMAKAQPQAVNAKLALMPQYYAQMLQQQGGLDRLVTTDDIAREAANNILAERAAEKMGVQVTWESVKEMLGAQPGMSNEVIEQAARAQNTTPWELIERARENQELGRVKQIKGLLAHASLFELWQEYSLAHDKLTLQLAAYPASAFEKDVVVNPQDLEKYLADHPKDFYVPPMRRYAYVKASKQDLMSAVKPSEQELQAYYEKNQSEYLRKPATHVEEIFAPLSKDQASTASLRVLNAVREQAAKEANWTSLTQTLNTQNPGMHFLRQEPWLEEETPIRSPEYLARIKTLTNDKVSSPIIDNQGIYLVRIKEQRPAGAPAFAEVRSRVETDFKEKKAAEALEAQTKKFRDELARLKTDNKTTTSSLRQFSQAVGIKDEITTRVKATDYTLPNVGSLYADRDYIAQLLPGQLSDVIQIPAQSPDTVAVIEVVEETPGYDPKLAEVKDKVDQAIRKERSVALARNAAEQSMNLIKGGAEFEKAVANAPKPLTETPPVTRTEPVQALGAPLIDFTKQTMKVDAGSTGLSPYGQDSEKPEGYAIWKVKKLDPPSQEQFAKDRYQFEQDYLQVQRETVVREWLADARRQAEFQTLDKSK